MKRLLWRIKYTLLGNNRTAWGLSVWWYWSGYHDERIADGDTPLEAVIDDISAALS
jgi:hypothetical protein